VRFKKASNDAGREYAYWVERDTDSGEAVQPDSELIQPQKVSSNDDAITDGSSSTLKSRRPLFMWAYIPEYDVLLNRIRYEKALKERWHFGKSEDSYPTILNSYLHFTFERLLFEKKLCENSNYAAFHTGLVDNKYDTIYFMFKKNTISGRSQWLFWDIAIAGHDFAGKELTRQFNPLPQRAKYFTNLSDCFYESNSPPQCDFTHILLERIDRLPYKFIEENCPTGFELMETDDMSEEEKKEYFIKLSGKIENNHQVLRNMTNRFRDSVTLSLKRVEWNYKTAIPMYYPKMKKMSLLLPIALLDDEKVDLALVTEKTASGSYLGHTILTLDMAYSSARLISRPDSDWLVADIDNISDDEKPNNERDS
jgi:hypothetical protein